MNSIYYYWDSEIFYKCYIQSDISVDYSVEKGEINQTLSVCFAHIFLFSLQMPLIWYVHSEENFVCEKVLLYWRRMFKSY